MSRSYWLSGRVLSALVATIIVARIVCADVPKEVDDYQLEISPANFATWRDHILPAQGELDFQKIPWLTTFKDGILAANREQRPLLLWVMNGHPLGCT